jgi:transposase-like protein
MNATVTVAIQPLLHLEHEDFLRKNGGRKNGHYRPTLQTRFGQLDLSIPRDRVASRREHLAGRYYPSFFVPYQRRLVDMGDVAIALYASGVSHRKAAEILGLLLGHRYSHETLSALPDRVLKAAESFRRRPLPRRRPSSTWTACPSRSFRKAKGWSGPRVYVALGVTLEGERRVLGYWLFPSENATAWEGVLRELRERGLERVLLFITDGLPGLAEAIARVYPLAQWQRCVVHGVRWSLNQVKPRDQALFAEELKRVSRPRTGPGRWRRWGAEPCLGCGDTRRWWGCGWRIRGPSCGSASLPRSLGLPREYGPDGAFYLGGKVCGEVRDHEFPTEAGVYERLYLESERRETKWGQRRLKGLGAAPQ